MGEVPIPEQFRRRLQAAAARYEVPQQRVQEVEDRIEALSRWQQGPYIAGWTHAVVMSVIERHAGCDQPRCETCADLTDVLAIMMVADKLRTDAEFESIVRRAQRDGEQGRDRPGSDERPAG